MEVLRLTHGHSLVERAVDEQEWRIAAIDIARSTCERDAVVRARARFASQVARHVRRCHNVLRERHEVEDSIPGNDRLDAIRFERGLCISNGRSQCGDAAAGTRQCRELTACRATPDSDSPLVDTKS